MGGQNPDENKFNYVLLNNQLLQYSFDTDKMVGNPYLHKFTLHLILSKRIADTLLDDNTISIELHEYLFDLLFMTTNINEGNELLREAFNIDKVVAGYLSNIHCQNLYRMSGGYLEFPKGFKTKLYV